MQHAEYFGNNETPESGNTFLKQSLDAHVNEIKATVMQGMTYVEFLYIFLKVTLDFRHMHDAGRLSLAKAASMQRASLAPIAALDARYSGMLLRKTEHDLDGILYDDTAYFAGADEACISAAVTEFLSKMDQDNYKTVMEG